MNKVLVIGSGPITIGQGAEFDYSGTQACQVLKEAGYYVVLVNPNPATIMTDSNIADAIYSEPLTVNSIEKIIEKEKPNYMLPGMGGQTALNLAMSLYETGILEKHQINILGTDIKGIKEAEDRLLFKQSMEAINQPVLTSKTACTVIEAKDIVRSIGYPVVIRPAYTLGGTGGGIAHDETALTEIVSFGIDASHVNQVLVEQSIEGWKEVEYEMMRDHKGNTIVVCNMENMDPVGIHTGDSIVVAPSQTLSDNAYQMLRTASIDIVNHLNIIGGCNVQLALNPSSLAYYIIEVNPRVSRSSALASKATGYPIAKIATHLALGKTLDEITNEVIGHTKACLEPVLDYCVVKVPRWPFDQMKDADAQLGTTMKATGEVMAICDSFEGGLLKAIKSLDLDINGLILNGLSVLSLQELIEKVKVTCHQRLFYIAELMRRQVSILWLKKVTGIDTYFLTKVQNIIQMENKIKDRKLEFISVDDIWALKKKGFSDAYIATLLLNTKENEVKSFRAVHSIYPSYQMVDTCSGEFEAKSPYYYSTYSTEDEVKVSNQPKVIIIGSGPIRIGQGIEFDYCSVQGIMALKKMGYESIMVNNNPETVSTDFNVADQLYFEPITVEDVYHIYLKEQPLGVILQFGGQTAIQLAEGLESLGVRILGTSYASIDLTENREKFSQIMNHAQMPQPKGYCVGSSSEALKIIDGLSFPVLVRPSYVIGGLDMKQVANKEALIDYVENYYTHGANQLWIDEYIEGVEFEVDVISDGQSVFVPGIIEHIEKSGVHSGDSIAIYPSISLKDSIKETVIDYADKIAKIFSLIGIFNIQMILKDDAIYVIEVNPRASRTVPFISKVTGEHVIHLATKALLGESLDKQNKVAKEPNFYASKHPIFSMEKVKSTDVQLNPIMKSTGEIMSIDYSLEACMYKGFLATYQSIPTSGRVILEGDEIESCKDMLTSAGFQVICETDTCLDDIAFVISLDGSKNSIGRLAVDKNKICFTSLDTLKMFLAVNSCQSEGLSIIDICQLEE